MNKQQFIQKMIDIFAPKEPRDYELLLGSYPDYYGRLEAVLHFLKDLDNSPDNSLESIWARRIMTRYDRFTDDWNNGYSINGLFPTPEVLFGVLIGFAQEAI